MVSWPEEMEIEIALVINGLELKVINQW